MAAIINVLFEGEVVPVPTDGIVFTSQLVEVATNKLRSKGTIRGGLNVFRISRADGGELEEDAAFDATSKVKLKMIDPLDTEPFAGGAHLILLERKPAPVVAAAAGVARAATAGAGRAARRAHEASDLTVAAGPAFEGEARNALSLVMRDVCPWAETTQLVSRILDMGEESGQADIFCYLRGESQEALASVPLSGLRVVEPSPEPGTVAPAPAIELAAGQYFSPYSQRSGPQKYFIVEASCTLKKSGRQEKLEQLEGLLELTSRRWKDRMDHEVTDITSIVGAAGLVFSAGYKKRAHILEKSCLMVTSKAGPLVKRLVQAQRFFVMVLDQSQTPVTFIARETEKIRQETVGIRQRLETIPEEVAYLLAHRG